MDLPTHFIFAIAVGLVFSGRYDIALLMALGALIIIPLVCILVILWQTRGGRDTMV